MCKNDIKINRYYYGILIILFDITIIVKHVRKEKADFQCADV